ncbi:hypothetical protein AAHB62_07955 [Bacillus cereus]
MLNYGVKMKKLLLVAAIIVSVLSTESMMNYHAAKAKVKKVEHQPKNIIMMVGGRNEFNGDNIGSLV